MNGVYFVVMFLPRTRFPLSLEVEDTRKRQALHSSPWPGGLNGSPGSGVILTPYPKFTTMLDEHILLSERRINCPQCSGHKIQVVGVRIVGGIGELGDIGADIDGAGLHFLSEDYGEPQLMIRFICFENAHFFEHLYELNDTGEMFLTSRIAGKFPENVNPLFI